MPAGPPQVARRQRDQPPARNARNQAHTREPRGTNLCQTPKKHHSNPRHGCRHGPQANTPRHKTANVPKQTETPPPATARDHPKHPIEIRPPSHAQIPNQRSSPPYTSIPTMGGKPNHTNTTETKDNHHHHTPSTHRTRSPTKPSTTRHHTEAQQHPATSQPNSA